MIIIVGQSSIIGFHFRSPVGREARASTCPYQRYIAMPLRSYEEILAGRYAPPNTFKFPSKAFGEKNIRIYRCQKSWFEANEWLHYNQSEDHVLCAICNYVYSDDAIVKKTVKFDAAFVSRGLSLQVFCLIRKKSNIQCL